MSGIKLAGYGCVMLTRFRASRFSELSRTLQCCGDSFFPGSVIDNDDRHDLLQVLTHLGDLFQRK